MSTTPKFSSKTATKTMINYASKELGIDLSHLADNRPELIVQLNLAEPGIYDTGDTQDGGGSGTEPQGGGSGTEPQGGGSGTEPLAKSGDASLQGGGSGTEPKAKVLKAVTLVINDDGDEKADNFVQVGVNGVMHQVMKGVEAKVPAGVYDVLQNAIETKYTTVTDPSTKMKSLKETKSKRWPFQVIAKHFE